MKCGLEYSILKNLAPVGAILLAALLLSGCQEEEQHTEQLIRPVRTVIIDPQPIEDDRQAIGEIRPRYETDLGFRVAGKLVSRLVDNGVIVKKGDLLARLDEQDFKTRIRSAKADVSSAKAVVSEAKSAEARSQKLLKKGVIARAPYDTALRNLRSARAQLDAANAALALAHDQLTYTELRADFGGIVTAVGADPGQVVAAGQHIVRLAKPKDKDGVFNIAESAFREEPSSEPIKIAVSLLSNPKIKSEGIVREISPVADPTTRTYQVKVTLMDPPAMMRFGASIHGRVNMESAPVIALPATALFDKAGKAAVWIFDQGTSTVKLQSVNVLRYQTNRVILSDGLVKGDIVVTAGVNRLREGQKVRLLPES